MKIEQIHIKKPRWMNFRVIMAFLLTLTFCLVLVIAMVLNRSRVERLTMEQLILEKSIKINDVISKLLYKTQILSTVMIQNGGEIEDFERTASAIVDDPAILNILVAPDGVVTNVYPIEGNEAVLGFDFFTEGAGNKEAALAKETRQLVLGGPFDALQGGQILVGRLPIFIHAPDGTENFWGLVSVTLRYPKALDGAGLNELTIQGFAYEIWRISPDTGERQIIASSGHNYSENTNYVEKQLSIANAEWYFRILPVRRWYEFPETWISLIVSVFVSFLIAAVIQNNLELKILQKHLEVLSSTDPLTDTYNRRYFLTAASAQMNRISRLSEEAFIIIFDLDDFKIVNDKYGHQVGDLVLKEISARVTNMLRVYDLFARYGGEEFIIFVTETSKESAIRIAERIREEISSHPIASKDNEIYITVSLGVAPAAPLYDLDNTIRMSDKALYRAKELGRNRVVFYEDENGDGEQWHLPAKP